MYIHSEDLAYLAARYYIVIEIVVPTLRVYEHTLQGTIGTLEYIGNIILLSIRLYYWPAKRTTVGNVCPCHIIIGTLMIHS